MTEKNLRGKKQIISAYKLTQTLLPLNSMFFIPLQLSSPTCVVDIEGL